MRAFANLPPQVANLADGIKMATDFVSIANLQRTERLVSELCSQRLATSWGDDVLHFYTTLWYTWVTAQQLYKKFLLGKGLDVSICDPLHRADYSEDNLILVDLANSDSTAMETHPMPIDGPQSQPDASCDQQARILPANIPSVSSPMLDGHSAAPKTERQ